MKLPFAPHAARSLVRPPIMYQLDSPVECLRIMEPRGIPASPRKETPMEIRIYRKAKLTTKPTKAVRAAVEHELMISRFPKPLTTEWFLSGEFHRLPIVPAHIIKNAPLRQRDYIDAGWIVPESEHGRINREPEKASQVIHAWIVRYMVAAGAIDRAEFAVVVDH